MCFFLCFMQHCIIQMLAPRGVILVFAVILSYLFNRRLMNLGVIRSSKSVLDLLNIFTFITYSQCHQELQVFTLDGII